MFFTPVYLRKSDFPVMLFCLRKIKNKLWQQARKAEWSLPKLGGSVFLKRSLSSSCLRCSHLAQPVNNKKRELRFKKVD